jgi:hypothetical protein
VAVDPTTGNVYVGFAQNTSGGVSAVIVPATSGATTPVVSVPGATVGGIAVTGNGYGLLEFDPNDNVGDRTWAAVGRFDGSGNQVFSTDLFRSSNLVEAGTLGAPDTSRLGYVPSADELVAYFGHTDMIQGVRHQGGYLATLSASGTQSVVSSWWGSHNLDQRMLVMDPQVGLIGLGDAYPKGIFFASIAKNPPTQVIYTLAGDGEGTVDGQLGGMVDLDTSIVVPFITNDSISQSLTPGNWPDIDAAIASQIQAAAADGNMMGLLLVPKTGSVPSGGLAPVWVNPSLSSGAHLVRLKAARYGANPLILLAWAEATGSTYKPTLSYFTMIVDATGAICQPKTPLPANEAFTGGDDFVRGPDGTIHWANVQNNQVWVVSLKPGG